jgi:hypothetical protein
MLVITIDLGNFWLVGGSAAYFSPRKLIVTISAELRTCTEYN